MINRLPDVKHRLARAANAATRNKERPSFTAAQAKDSLNRSLAALRTDHIDLWLLHEVQASDLQDEGLLQLLEAEVKNGTIGNFGIGSSADRIPALLAERPAYCRTLQYEWSVVEAPILSSEPFRIHHRTLTKNFLAFQAALSRNQTLCRRWSQSVNADLSSPENLARLMLKAALILNPASIILFSSKKPAHIQSNVSTAEDSTLEAAALQLHNIIREERDQLLPTAT